MPSFEVRYFDPLQSAVVDTSAVAGSEHLLRAQLAGQGHIVLRFRTQRVPRAATARGNFKVDVAWWCRELGTLLKAGMSVVEALETLDAQAQGTARQEIHEQLLRALREGKGLSKAMRGTGVFPAVLVASVTASERTSTLANALEDFLRYDTMLQRLKRQALSAAIYPAAVVTLGILISLFLILYVVPRFSRMYKDFHGEVSWPTQLLIGVSQTLHEHMPWVLAGLLAVVVLLGWAWSEGHVARAAARLVEAIAPLRRQWQHFRLANLYQSLALMFRGGYTLDEALQVCEGMGLGAAVLVGITRARAELARGRSVAAAFNSASLTDTVSHRLLAVGERSGSFDAILQTIADRHAGAFATFVERATRVIEPLLLLVVALVVGGIVVMMYMPVFDIANGVR
jgi:general secretion pathway protein F